MTNFALWISSTLLPSACSCSRARLKAASSAAEIALRALDTSFDMASSFTTVLCAPNVGLNRPRGSEKTRSLTRTHGIRLARIAGAEHGSAREARGDGQP